MTSDSSPAPHGCGRRYYNNSLKMEMTVCLLYLYGPTSFHKSHRHSPTIIPHERNVAHMNVSCFSCSWNDPRPQPDPPG